LVRLGVFGFFFLFFTFLCDGVGWGLPKLYFFFSGWCFFLLSSFFLLKFWGGKFFSNWFFPQRGVFTFLIFSPTTYKKKKRWDGDGGLLLEGFFFFTLFWTCEGFGMWGGREKKHKRSCFFFSFKRLAGFFWSFACRWLGGGYRLWFFCPKQTKGPFLGQGFRGGFGGGGWGENNGAGGETRAPLEGGARRGLFSFFEGKQFFKGGGLFFGRRVPPPPWRHLFFFFDQKFFGGEHLKDQIG